MIQASRFHSSSIKTALYYVRLQTHNGVALFHAAAINSTEKPTESKRQHSQRKNNLEAMAPASMAPALTQIAAEELSLTAHYQSITVGQWGIFPNGLHALISVRDQTPDSHATSSKPRLLTSFVASFKAATAKRINMLRNQPGSPVWQRSYKEQLVQDEITLSRLKKQIINAEDLVASGNALSQVI